MATKKTVKSKAVKKSAPKKKSPTKKKSTVKQSQAYAQREVIDRDLDSSYEESNTPNYQPSVSEESKEKSGNPIFRFLIIAGLILIALIVYSQFAKRSNSEVEPAKTTEQASKPTASTTSISEVEPVVEKAKSENLSLGEYNLENIAKGKTLAEAKEFCKSLSLNLPSSKEFKSYKSTLGASIPKEFEGSDFWTDTAGMAIKFNFSSGKGITAPASDKHSVVCKK